MNIHQIELNDYQIANLLAMIEAAGYVTTLHSQNPGRNPLWAIQSGDWLGELYWKLPKTDYPPCRTAIELAKHAYSIAYEANDLTKEIEPRVAIIDYLINTKGFRNSLGVRPLSQQIAMFEKGILKDNRAFLMTAVVDDGRLTIKDCLNKMHYIDFSDPTFFEQINKICDI